MNFGWVTTTPGYKRIPEVRDTVHRITQYGTDNLYPQRMQSVSQLSPVAKSAISLIAHFITGNGFERGDEVINREGETANDILRLIAQDQALFNGYALHLNSTGLGVVSEVRQIPFEFVRLGLANQSGEIRDVRVSNNWESSNSDKLPTNELNEVKYQIFNHYQNGTEALTTAKGMVLYATPKKNCYPLSAIDPIIETCQADHELAVFELGNITNGFLSMSIFKYPGGSDMEAEKQALSDKLNQLKGAKNANSILVASVDEDWEGGNLVENIPANNNDTLFAQTTINTRNRIVQSMGVLPSMIGIMPEGSVFTSVQMADSYTYMNLRTKEIRNNIQRQFQKLGLDVGRIIPNQYESSQMLDDNQPADAVTA